MLYKYKIKRIKMGFNAIGTGVSALNQARTIATQAQTAAQRLWRGVQEALPNASAKSAAGNVAQAVDNVTPPTNFAGNLANFAKNNPWTTAGVAAGALGAGLVGKQLLGGQGGLTPLPTNPATAPIHSSADSNNGITPPQSFINNGSSLGGIGASGYGGGFGLGGLQQQSPVNFAQNTSLNSAIPTADAFGVGIGSRTDLTPLTELPTGSVNMNIGGGIGGIGGIGGGIGGIGGIGLPPLLF
jgi:hypothetical protein